MSLDVYLELDKCPHCGRTGDYYDASITHNLGAMAEEAGVYGVAWHPEDNGINTAGDLIEPLKKAIDLMTDDPKRFKKYNDPNDWGRYENLLSWLQNYLDACESMPAATVNVSR